MVIFAFLTLDLDKCLTTYVQLIGLVSGLAQRLVIYLQILNYYAAYSQQVHQGRSVRFRLPPVGILSKKRKYNT